MLVCKRPGSGGWWLLASSPIFASKTLCEWPGTWAVTSTSRMTPARPAIAPILPEGIMVPKSFTIRQSRRYTANSAPCARRRTLLHPAGTAHRVKRHARPVGRRAGRLGQRPTAPSDVTTALYRPRRVSHENPAPTAQNPPPQLQRAFQP